MKSTPSEKAPMMPAINIHTETIITPSPLNTNSERAKTTPAQIDNMSGCTIPTSLSNIFPRSALNCKPHATLKNRPQLASDHADNGLTIIRPSRSINSHRDGAHRAVQEVERQWAMPEVVFAVNCAISVLHGTVALTSLEKPHSLRDAS